MKKVLFLLISLLILIPMIYIGNIVVDNFNFVNGAIELADSTEITNNGIQLVVLGTVQDAGSPHIACKKKCCATLFKHPDSDKMVVSLGLIDFNARKKYLFEATPDISRQIKLLHQHSNFKNEIPNGIFLTHAHIGHYSGLMYLGKEAMSASGVAVYAMPRMKEFLERNGPWSQLVKLKNIQLMQLAHESTIELSNSITITPFLVPHRDEFSETVGYRIVGPKKTAIFIPDIDKWDKWEVDIRKLINEVDYAFIDATFYDGEEINNRDISEIPHPFIIESMELFKNLSNFDKQKVHFIHLNHTNPALNKNNSKVELIVTNGFNIAQFNSTFEL